MKADLLIDHLSLSLPATLRGHERTFSRSLARELGKLPFTDDTHLSSLKMPPIQMRPGETVNTLARRIATNLHVHITNPQTSRNPLS